MRILENELRRAALERRKGELEEASAGERARIMEQVDREVRKEVWRRINIEPGSLLH